MTPSARLPQNQPTCITDVQTDLYDCGNWGVSASWNVPSTAVSGVSRAWGGVGDHVPLRDPSAGEDVRGPRANANADRASFLLAWLNMGADTGDSGVS